MIRKQLGFGLVAAALLVLASASPAYPQWTSASEHAVSASDIQRLQDQASQAGSDLSRLRGTSADQAARLQLELDDLRDEVVYLKVKLRKEGRVSAPDYADVRDRLQDFRSRARGEPVHRSTGPVVNEGGIPVGQELDVRLQDPLSSATSQVEERFQATTMADLYRGDALLIPAGSIIRGVVSSVDKATRTDRSGSLTVTFDQITVEGRSYPMRGTVTQAIESSGIKGEVGKIATGGAVGAIIGGIIGGGKGALIGVLVGGGGVMAATAGKDVTLEPGTVLRVRLDKPPVIR